MKEEKTLDFLNEKKSEDCPLLLTGGRESLIENDLADHLQGNDLVTVIDSHQGLMGPLTVITAHPHPLETAPSEGHMAGTMILTKETDTEMILTSGTGSPMIDRLLTGVDLLIAVICHPLIAVPSHPLIVVIILPWTGVIHPCTGVAGHPVQIGMIFHLVIAVTMTMEETEGIPMTVPVTLTVIAGVISIGEKTHMTILHRRNPALTMTCPQMIITAASHQCRPQLTVLLWS